MLTLKDDKVIFTDVDDTLIIWPHNLHKYPNIETFEIGINGPKMIVAANLEMIQFLHSVAAAGVSIVVWSRSGYAWAEHVVKVLQLDNIVSMVVSKPYMFMDDKPITDLGETTWFGPKKE